MGWEFRAATHFLLDIWELYPLPLKQRAPDPLENLGAEGMQLKLFPLKKIVSNFALDF